MLILYLVKLTTELSYMLITPIKFKIKLKNIINLTSIFKLIKNKIVHYALK